MRATGLEGSAFGADQVGEAPREGDELLDALGVTPRDMISILQTIKAQGALQADIEVM